MHRIRKINIEIVIKPWFTKMCDYFWDNRKNILKEYPDAFDFPDYCGLPKNIVNELTTDFVDLLQGVHSIEIFDLLINSKSKKQFVKSILDAAIKSNYDCNLLIYTVK